MDEAVLARALGVPEVLFARLTGLGHRVVLRTQPAPPRPVHEQLMDVPSAAPYQHVGVLREMLKMASRAGRSNAAQL